MKEQCLWPRLQQRQRRNRTTPDETPAEAEPTKAVGKRKLILLAVAPVALAGSAPGCGSPACCRAARPRHTDTKEAAAKPVAPIFIDLPEMVANLNSNPRRPSYVKLSPASR